MLPVALTYSDPDGDTPLTLAASSDNEAVATVSQNSEFELQVTAVSAGVATISVSVDDGLGGIANTAFTVEVVAPNQQPTIDPIAPVSLTVGDSIPVTISTSDPDGDILTITPIVDLSTIATVALNSPTELQVTAVSAGFATVSVSVDDGRGGVASTAFTIEVIAPNQQPIIDPISPINVNVGDVTPIAISYSDPDGDVLTLSAFSDNDGVASVISTTPFELQVTANGAGTANITVSIDDGRGGVASTAFTVNVAALNQQPIIDPISPINVNVGDVTPVAISYSDPDGDALTLSAFSDNDGVASVISTTPFELQVTANGAGTANITVSIDDGRGGVASTAFTVNVAALNQQPIIDPISPISMSITDVVPVAISYSDPDGDALTLSAFSDNDGVASVISTTPFELQITANGVGTASISVSVDDGRGGVASTAFMVEVGAGNTQPVIDPIAPVSLTIGDVTVVAISYSDLDGDVLTMSVFSDNDGIVSVLSTTPFELQLTANGIGTATISVSVDDGRGGVASTAFTAEVLAGVVQSTFDINAIPERPDFEQLERLKEVYANGLTAGNLNTIFTIVGDDSLSNTNFIDPIALGQYNLGSFPQLQNAIDHYDFNTQSLAYGENWTVETLLDSAFADPGLCQPGETPLACELRMSAPIVMFISFNPTNATAVPIDTFRLRLEEIVDVALRGGTIPILVTLPDDGLVDPVTLNQYNEVIYNVAKEHTSHPDLDVPLWNLYLTMQNATQGVYAVSASGAADYSDVSLTYGVNRRGANALAILEAFRQTFIVP